jgi:hypothetical protein
LNLYRKIVSEQIVTLVDGRGRIGGKLNLIDAIIAIAIVGLAATSYAGYRMFRTPDAKLFAIEPSVIFQRQDVPVTVRGENLRPYMRVTFNNAVARSDVVLWDARQLVTAQSYVLGNTSYATFQLPELMAATYDVILWNDRREIARLPSGLRILPLAPPLLLEMNVRGVFERIPDIQAGRLKANGQFPPQGVSARGAPTGTIIDLGAAGISTTVMAIGPARMTMPVRGHVDVPAILRVKCFAVSNPDGSVRCAVPGPIQQADVAAGSKFFVKTQDDWLTFQISEVLPSKPSR